MDGDLEIRPGMVIASAELEWSFVSSGGPGGQHANRSRTKAVVRFDIENSTSLTASQRTRLLEKLPAVVIVDADDERSQWQNRRLARERLAERLRDGWHRPRARRATKPSKGAKRRRMAAKRQRSEVKKNRQRPGMHD